MKIVKAKHMGFCFGVKKVLKLTRKTLEEAKKNGSGRKVYSVGPLIHNMEVMKEYEDLGLEVVADLSQITSEGILIIRSHGLPPEVFAEAKRKGLQLRDGTCPVVKRIQSLALELKKEGYQVVIIGERKHPEIAGILGHVSDAFVVENLEMARNIPFMERMGVVVQTTQIFDCFKEIVDCILDKALEWKIYNTICKATMERQRAVTELADEVDIIIVVGGYDSANTRHLVEICRNKGIDTYHIEKSEELKAHWLNSGQRVGITAGASTSEKTVEEVIEKIRKLGATIHCKDQNAN